MNAEVTPQVTWVEGFQLRPGAPYAEHGQGLAVVAALSKRWGVGRISEHYKAVWCELAVDREVS